MITIYDPVTKTITRQDAEIPEPIPEPDMTLRAEDNYIINEIFQSVGEIYKALTNINKGDKLIVGTNCEPVDLIKLLNEQNDELKAAKILLGVD